MPDIRLSDNASLALTFAAATGSAFNRYLSTTTPINIQLKEKQPTTGGLAQFIPSGLCFTDKFRLGELPLSRQAPCSTPTKMTSAMR
jgi:hypothetical protein